MMSQPYMCAALRTESDSQLAAMAPSTMAGSCRRPSSTAESRRTTTSFSASARSSSVTSNRCGMSMLRGSPTSWPLTHTVPMQSSPSKTSSRRSPSARAGAVKLRRYHH